MTQKNQPITAIYADCEKMLNYGLTAQEYAAISLRVPDSGEPWLDDMIRHSRRMDAVQAAMQGMLTHQSQWEHHEHLASNAVRCADAVIAREAESWVKL